MDFILPGFETPRKEKKSEKGLLNLIGENNCFLNVVIQSLWHLEAFRSQFNSPKLKKEHKHTSQCVYCALEVIFTQYRFSDESQLPPTALRETMAIIYKNQSRFQLFAIDDAGEALEAVLECLHSQFTDPALHGCECYDSDCLAHQVFGIHTTELIRCTHCNASTEAKSSSLFTVYSYAAALRTVFEKEPTLSFAELLYKASEDKRSCPNRKTCDKLCNILHFLTSAPQVFSVSIVWDTPEPTLAEIKTSLEMITLRLDISKVFLTKDNHIRSNVSSPCHYRLRGLICYYGKHYIAYFKNYSTGLWFVFDDMTVKEIGNEWSQIQQRCLRGRLQPSVLFYEREDPFENTEDPFVTIPKGETTPKSDLVLKISQSIRPEDSFIFVDPSPDERDFIVTRTNWMYRKQTRLLRLAKDKFMRVEPSGESGLVKESFSYKDIFEIVFTSSTHFIMNFYSGREAQYIECKKIDELIDLLKQRAKEHNHSFIIRNQ